MKEQTLFIQSALFAEVLITLQKNVSKESDKKRKKYRAAGHLDNIQTETTPWKCFRYGSEDHLISKYLNPPKENEKRQKQVRFHEKGNRACNNGKNNSDQKMYASMHSMYVNYECSGRKFGDRLQLTNCILDSGAMCHMTPEVLKFIPVLLEDTDKHIEVAGGHHVTGEKEDKYK